MKITKTIKISSGVYVLFAGKNRIFVNDDCFYSNDCERTKYTDTEQVLEWLLWVTEEDLKKIK